MHHMCVEDEQAPLPSGVIERLKNVSSGSLTTELYKRGFLQCFLVGLRPLNASASRFAGEAFTMRFVPARHDKDTYETLTPFANPDNLQWEGVEQIPQGHVLVIDSRMDSRAASMGNMLLTRMMVRGVAGVVTDGSFRDGQEIASMGIPAYCRDVVASTRLSYHRVADLQVPIGCAGVAVYPGDVIVGDGDGVTVVPRFLAAELADACEERDRLEHYLQLRIAAGECLYGVYPPNEKTLTDYRAWVAAGSVPREATLKRSENSHAAR